MRTWQAAYEHVFGAERLATLDIERRRAQWAELMTAALAALRQSGFSAVSLWVLEDNPRARRFYEREGWAQTGGRGQEFLGIPITEVGYRITLG